MMLIMFVHSLRSTEIDALLFQDMIGTYADGVITMQVKSVIQRITKQCSTKHDKYKELDLIESYNSRVVLNYV